MIRSINRRAYRQIPREHIRMDCHFSAPPFEKRIPNWSVYSMERDALSSLRGYLDGPGHIHPAFVAVEGRAGIPTRRSRQREFFNGGQGCPPYKKTLIRSGKRRPGHQFQPSESSCKHKEAPRNRIFIKSGSGALFFFPHCEQRLTGLPRWSRPYPPRLCRRGRRRSTSRRRADPALAYSSARNRYHPIRKRPYRM